VLFLGGNDRVTTQAVNGKFEGRVTLIGTPAARMIVGSDHPDGGGYTLNDLRQQLT
jgi:hypothetical protein